MHGDCVRETRLLKEQRNSVPNTTLSTLKDRLHRGFLWRLHDTIPANENRYLCRRHLPCRNQRHHQLLGRRLLGYSYSALASANSYPWNARDMYTLQSPLFNADKINTPILFLHGTVDTNVPVGESIQMFTALKLLGKPTASYK